LGYRKRDARRLGSGLFVHGLGGCGSSREERSCEYLVEEANAGSLSWSYGLDQDHDEVRRVLDAAAGGETQLRRLLSRPFARKLAGVPRSATFDPKTRHFTLAFYPYARTSSFCAVCSVVARAVLCCVRRVSCRVVCTQTDGAVVFRRARWEKGEWCDRDLP
jgi:hypothetical protein